MNPKVIILSISVVIIGIAGGTLYYLNRPAAEEASISNALTALEEGGVTAAATPSRDPAGAAPEGDDVTGIWMVDTTIGQFDFGDATSTFAGFRVDEELRNVGQTEAVGRTPAVAGTLDIDGTLLQEALIEVDFTQLVSDIPRRDNAMKDSMNVQEYPIATFALTEPIDFGAVPTDGDSTDFTAVGDLTVNGITRPTEFAMEASLADGNILVVGRTPVVFERFFIRAPKAGPVVDIADEGTIELQIWFTRA